VTGRRRDLRVLHVVSSTDRRGAETSAVELCSALGEVGFGGSTVALAAGTVGGLDLPVLGSSRFATETLRSLRNFARAHDLVIAHGSSTLPAVAAATIGLATPFVYRSVGDPGAWATTPARRVRVRVGARRAARVVALWRESAVAWHEVLGIRPDRIVVIPNGVRADRFPVPRPDEKVGSRIRLGLPEHGPVALCLGALSPEKRVDLAIEAVADLPGVTLAVVGEGGERASLERLAADRAGDRVRLLGAINEPWPALAAADVLLLPSDTEGQPAVAIEAGLTGLPVVATRVGGVAEIVLDGRSGLLVDPGDVAGLAAAIQRCLGQRDELGTAARSHCLQNFSLDRITRKWSTLLQSVITG
jgi:glycosyltransferase involved in cell wall biosynthesis